MTTLPIWSFNHNWANGLDETLEWLTTVLVSQTGAEQRMQQRIAPRRFFEYSLVMTGPERTYFDLMLQQYGGSDWYIPVAHDAEIINAPLNPGDMFIPMDTMNREFLTGSKVLVSSGDARFYEVLRIDQVIETGLTLIVPVVSYWSAGSVMTPLITGHMVEQPKMTRKNSDVWTGNIKFRSTDENNWPIGTNLNILLNEDGLVVNAFQPQSGRGAYFDQASGTSEGQLILAMGLMDAANMLGDARAYTLAQRMLDATMATTYNGIDPPEPVTQTATFAPHWLFVVKKPIKACVVNYGETFSFSNGVAQVPDVHGPTRLVFRVFSTDYQLLWKNPYSSSKAGTEYIIDNYEYDAVNEYTVVTLQDLTVSGELVVIYSSQNGNTLEVGDRYEAWPDWRPLAAGETDCACDTLNWAYRCFAEAAGVLNNPYYADCAQATIEQTAIIYDVNDSRDWIKPSFTKNAFGDGSRFSFSSRGAPVVFACDDEGNVLMTLETGTGEAQYGNASIKDIYHKGDSTTVLVGSTRAVTITVFIDESQTYDYNTRWSHTLSLAGSGQPESFTLKASDFSRVDGTIMPDETAVYTFGFDDKSTRAHTLIIGRVRQAPNLVIPYYKGAIPFTANFLGQPLAVLIDWRGPIYMGYQSPWMWLQMADKPSSAKCMQLLFDSQQHYLGLMGYIGPFTPVFIFDRSDAYQYGDVNTFGFVGPDPNTKWGGYQYRPLAEVAQYYYEVASGTTVSNQASTVCNNWFHFLSQIAWPSTGPTASGGVGASGPPTDYPDDGSYLVNYDEPHFAALIIRAVIFCDLKDRPGSNNGTSGMGSYRLDLLNKAMAFWTRTYVADPTNRMFGTFCTDTVNLSWFGFWHGEIMRTFKYLNDWAIQRGLSSIYNQTYSWMTGMLDWAWANSLQPNPTPVYAGYDVIVLPPNDREDLDVTYTRLTDEIDNKVATPIEQDEAARAFPIQSYTYQLVGRADHYDFRSMIYVMKGRMRPVWMPTFQRDIIMAIPAFAQSSTMVIEYIGYSDIQGWTIEGKKNFCIFYADGTVSCHLIARSADYGQGTENLSFSPRLPVDCTPQSVVRISFMDIGRFDTDSFEVKHYTDNKGVSEIGVTFKMIGDFRVADDYTQQPPPNEVQNDSFTHFPPAGVDQTTVIYGYFLSNGFFGQDDSDLTEVLFPPAAGVAGDALNGGGGAGSQATTQQNADVFNGGDNSFNQGGGQGSGR